MQDVVPALHLAVIVKPVFLKHWKNVVIDNRLHPFIRSSFFCSAAERLYCVHRYANRLGNLAIAVSSRTEFDDLRFLIIGHILSAPSEG